MKKTPLFSVVIPARNEEAYIRACLDSIKLAEKELGASVEIIVALNRCTDRTEEIAKSYGALITEENAKNLSKIRNAGAKKASGKILVTIDADSHMSPTMFSEIKKYLDSGKYIGGGVLIKPERISVGILMTSLTILLPVLLKYRVSGGLFWCLRKDFEKLNGFDETFLTGEDLDFALRLRRLGKNQGKSFKTIYHAHIVSSCRKFDEFGDWFMIKNPWTLWKFLRGRDRKIADKIWYDVKR